MKSFHRLPGIKRALCFLLLAGVLPLSACGDPDAGTISAPPRDSMKPGATGDASKTTKKLSPKAEPKTLSPGGKKLPG